MGSLLSQPTYSVWEAYLEWKGKPTRLLCLQVQGSQLMLLLCLQVQGILLSNRIGKERPDEVRTGSVL